MADDERIALLGASRGLGAAVARQYRVRRPSATLLLMARDQMRLSDERTVLRGLGAGPVDTACADFSRESGWQEIFDRIGAFRPNRILYFAGGGPHGRFAAKAWKDHLWSFNVNFLFPARLLHEVLKSARSGMASPMQLLLTGSLVAEQNADPQAASYAAGKHALFGLTRSVFAESPPVDLRLFSPGYMDTDLLPSSAWPRRHAPALVSGPDNVASCLLDWLDEPANEFHRTYGQMPDSGPFRL